MLSSVLSYFTSCFKFSGQVSLYCLFPVLDSQPTATELYQSPLYGSGTVFHSISHLLRHFLSSALAWRHTSSNSVIRNYCCRAREVILSFMDMLIALTYLLTVMYQISPHTWCLNGVYSWSEQLIAVMLVDSSSHGPAGRSQPSRSHCRRRARVSTRQQDRFQWTQVQVTDVTFWLLYIRQRSYR